MDCVCIVPKPKRRKAGLPQFDVDLHTKRRERARVKRRHKTSDISCTIQQRRCQRVKELTTHHDEAAASHHPGIALAMPPPSAPQCTSAHTWHLIINTYTLRRFRIDVQVPVIPRTRRCKFDHLRVADARFMQRLHAQCQTLQWAVWATRPAKTSALALAPASLLNTC